MGSLISEFTEVRQIIPRQIKVAGEPRNHGLKFADICDMCVGGCIASHFHVKPNSIHVRLSCG